MRKTRREGSIWKRAMAIPEKLCRDTLIDLPRYLLSGKYRYKKAILGRAVSTWERMLAGACLGIAALILLWGSLTSS